MADSDPYETIFMFALPIDVDLLCSITKAIEKPLTEAGWSDFVISTGGRIRGIPPNERSPNIKALDSVDPPLKSSLSSSPGFQHREGIVPR